LLSVGKGSNTPSLPCLRGLSTVQRDVIRSTGSQFSFPSKDIILVTYIDDMILIGPSE
jgi:hypothetical protein